ncbi:MAG: acyl-CoA thioesterase domain-containing protein, partial [Pseudomonadales bacterium]
MKAIFHRDGDHYLPQDPARGPWGESLHGGAPAALLTQALTDLVAVPFPLARLTLDMFRPVPLAPLALTGTVLRKGKRLALAEMTLSAEGVPCARALGLFSAPSPLPEGAVTSTPCPLPRGRGAVVETLAQIVASRVGRKLPPGDGLHHHLLAEGFDGAVGGGRGAGHR